MTATERVRQLLDERGVEWLDDSYAQLWCTVWDGQDGKQWRMTENQSGMLTELKAWHVTPEQAIAATLGLGNAGRYVGLRQGEYWERTENSDYYCGGCGWKVTDHDSYCPECGGALHKAALGSCNCSNSERTGTCLPHFWTHDGALHIEATRMPTRIVVCEGGTCEFVPKRELDTSEAENAKLRKLARDMWFWGYEGHMESKSQEWQMKHIDGVLDCMRELGVEVD